jgi:hypothetical protein
MEFEQQYGASSKAHWPRIWILVYSVIMVGFFLLFLSVPLFGVFVNPDLWRSMLPVILAGCWLVFSLVPKLVRHSVSEFAGSYVISVHNGVLKIQGRGQGPVEILLSNIGHLSVAKCGMGCSAIVVNRTSFGLTWDQESKNRVLEMIRAALIEARADTSTGG